MSAKSKQISKVVSNSDTYTEQQNEENKTLSEGVESEMKSEVISGDAPPDNALPPDDTNIALPIETENEKRNEKSHSKYKELNDFLLAEKQTCDKYLNEINLKTNDINLNGKSDTSDISKNSENGIQILQNLEDEDSSKSTSEETACARVEANLDIDNDSVCVLRENDNDNDNLTNTNPVAANCTTDDSSGIINRSNESSLSKVTSDDQDEADFIEKDLNEANLAGVTPTDEDASFPVANTDNDNDNDSDSPIMAGAPLITILDSSDNNVTPPESSAFNDLDNAEEWITVEEATSCSLPREESYEKHDIGSESEESQATKSLEDLDLTEQSNNASILTNNSSMCMKDINDLEDLVSDMSSVIDANLSSVHTNMFSASERIESTETITSSTESQSIVSESHIEKSAVKKKSSENGKKKSKKTKKNDSEKENISVRAKSMGDLRKLDAYPGSFKEQIYTGVSVKALRASYCNLANLNDSQTSKEPPPKPVRWVSASLFDMKSSFNKFDALQKKTILHVRSGDSGKAQEKFNGTQQETDKNCRACQKVVFLVEQVKAEKHIWHRNCFRCKDCNKQLTVDNYSSHESLLYCKPHFKALFTPKVVEDSQPIHPRKHEMIIRESQPMELPPDVFRASDKPDLGLEELSTLNVKSRFQVFEQSNDEDHSIDRSPSTVNVKRSPSILSKLARFQAKGMDIGVTDDSLNGVRYEESSSEEEEPADEGDEDMDLVKAKRLQKETPIAFGKMSDIKTKFEAGHTMTKEERREERKQEIQSIRSRLFMGKQAKIKEMYQQAVLDSEQGVSSAKKQPIVEISDSTKSIKEKFEKGEAFHQDEDDESKLKDNEDMAVFSAGISKKSRSLFMELDATAARNPQIGTPQASPRTPEVRKVTQVRTDDVIKCGERIEDVHVETSDLSNRFKFFETFKPAEHERKQFRITPPREGVTKVGSPDREVYRDPDVVRADDTPPEDPDIAEKSHTATKMLSIFRQMEEKKESVPQGLKPLKRFTPPPEEKSRVYQNESDSQEESSSEEEEEEEDSKSESEKLDYVRASDKYEDEFLKQAQNAARAKQLRAKFEKWETNEIKREQSGVNLHEECADDSQIESAKSLRARFESMRETTQTDRSPKVKVNRFVEIQSTNVVLCDICEKKVYPLEKVECDSKIYHKQCFRCSQCNAALRMDTYTHNQGVLYCISHFKQLFITKGNYESGFGIEQYKFKWEMQKSD